jgi:hypothetical protein
MDRSVSDQLSKNLGPSIDYWFNCLNAWADATVMKPDFTRTEQERQGSSHAQEIEYALILQRMISAVRDDPKQMRLTVYEFARARLKIDTARAEESERKRLSNALETAIQGVEEFLVRREETEQLPPPNRQAQVMPVAMPVASPPPVVASHRTVTPAPEDILVPNKTYARVEAEPAAEGRTRALVGTLARFCIGMFLFGVVVSLAYYKHQLPLLRDNLTQLAPVSTAVKPAAAPAVAPAAPDPRVAAASSGEPSLPIPSDYGVYALSNDTLNELYALPERVPDKRIAVSTPLEQPSRTTLTDGKTRFIVFRRDLVGNAPDRIEIRVVAQVARVLSFDAKGRPNISPVSGTWNIRNISYEFRVRPVPGNPEMLLVQSEKPAFALPAGRYALVLKDQGYDFTVAGKISEPVQCLERTDAANGSFYSECLKP